MPAAAAASTTTITTTATTTTTAMLTKKCCNFKSTQAQSKISMHLGIWLLPILLLVLLQQQTCECRYLPTRSHGDDLDKLRELMLQILESSNEEQRPPNEANGNTLAQRANWWNKLNAGDALEVQRKPFTGRGGYDGVRFY